jgi:antitoxin (DNA-binding transcriptional repressor) of toxin-antitoxin stability system
VKTITVRDLRQRWPEAEAALQLEDEIIVTRDAQPVARLIRFSNNAPQRRRWDAKEHARWQKKVAGGKISKSDKALAASRADRQINGKR